jgi:hypothetical protein
MLLPRQAARTVAQRLKFLIVKYLRITFGCNTAEVWVRCRANEENCCAHAAAALGT